MWYSWQSKENPFWGDRLSIRSHPKEQPPFWNFVETLWIRVKNYQPQLVSLPGNSEASTAVDMVKSRRIWKASGFLEAKLTTNRLPYTQRNNKLTQKMVVFLFKKKWQLKETQCCMVWRRLFFAVNYNKTYVPWTSLWKNRGLELNPNRVIRAPFCWGTLQPKIWEVQGIADVRPSMLDADRLVSGFRC